MYRSASGLTTGGDGLTSKKRRQLRAKLLEVCEDYLLYHKLLGDKRYSASVRRAIGELGLSKLRDDALWAAKRLLAAAERLDALAPSDVRQQEPALIAMLVDALPGPELGRLVHKSPDLGAILEGYCEVHTSFKPHWAAAKDLGVDIGQAVANLRTGRPPGTASFPTTESFNTAQQQAILRLRERRAFNPSGERIAEEMGISRRRYYELKRA